MNSRIRFAVLSFFLLLISFSLGQSWAQTEVSGTLPGNTTWGPNESYLVTSDLTVPEGVTLTILSGCTVQFDSNADEVLVYGNIQVQGTSGSPVNFSSDSAEHSWGGLLIDGSPGSSVSHAVFDGGGSGYFAIKELLQIKNCSPSISNCTFRNSQQNGVRFVGSDSALSNCTVQNCADDAFEMDVASSPQFSSVTVSGNGYNGVRILTGTTASDRGWNAAAFPYLINEDVTVGESTTLTIAAGNQIEFESDSRDLIVQGTLLAVGTKSLPIVFTVKDDVEDELWGGIYFGAAAGDSRMEYCELRRGGSGYFSAAWNSMVRCENSSPTFVECQLNNSNRYGMSLAGSNATLSQVTINDSLNTAIYMEPDCFPTFTSISASGNEYDAIEIQSGQLSSTGRWDYAEIPYLINSDLAVPQGTVLTIDPQTEIQFKSDSADLIVNGQLSAVGTASKPILFNSVNRTEEAGRWGGIVLSGTEATSSAMQFCELNYGGSNYFSSSGVSVLKIDGCSPTITDCKISYARYDGMNLYDSDATIERCTFTGCGENAIRMDGGSFPSFADNSATDNGYDVIAVRTGELEKSGRWDHSSLHYKLDSDFTIPEGRHLTIDAGNTIHFQTSSTDLIVYGSLEALGTNEENITFTHLNNPVRGAYGGLYFGPSVDDSRTKLTYCVFEYGGSNYFSSSSASMVFCDRCSPSFSNCTFRNSGRDGLWIRTGRMGLNRLRFINNKDYAVRIIDNAFPSFSGLTASGNGLDGILIKDSQWSETGTWKNAGIPYVIYYDVVVDVTGDVTIDPGVTVKFHESSADLIVKGNLKCEGTDANPIAFTSWHENPPPGRWGALSFEQGSTGSLSKTSIEYGGSNYFSNGWTSMLRLRSGSQVSVDQVELANSGTSGMIVEATETTIRNGVFEDCKEHGLHALAQADVTVTDCEFSNCENGVYAAESAVVHLTSSILSNNTNALATDSGGSSRIHFGENQFTNNNRTGKVNFLTAASSRAGNMVSGDSGGLEVHWGDLSGSGTFHPILGGFYEFANSFYHSRHITGSGSLQIRPGTFLAIRESARLIVQDDGYLGAIGRAEQPILISAPPDVESSTAENLMLGIHFEDQSRGAFKNVVLRNAGLSGAIECLDSSNVTVEQCSFDYNERAIHLMHSANLLVEYCQFTNNGDALEADDYMGTASMQFCRISGNDSGVDNSPGSVNVDASLNWWGDASGPSGQGPGAGDAISEFVLYEPFFTSAGQVPGQPLDPKDVDLNTVYSEEISRFGLILYRVSVAQGSNLLCELTQGNSGSRYGLYANLDSQPSVAQSEYFVVGPGLRDTHELLIADATGGQYYVLVFADKLATEHETYEIEFKYVDEYVVDLSPREGGNRGPVTISLTGAEFDSSTEVLLRGASGDRSPVSTFSPKPDELHASFSLSGAALGMYDLEVSWPGSGAKQTFDDVFQVVTGVGARLETELVLPEIVRPNRLYTMLIRYHNAGDADMFAPLLTVRSLNGAPVSLTAEGPYSTDPLQLLGVFQEGPAGVLPPGSSGEIPVYFQGILDFNIGFAVDTIKDPGEVVDWETSSKWQDFVDRVGSTWGDYQAALAALATELWQKGAVVYDAAALQERILSEIRDLPLGEAHGQVVDSQSGHPQAGVPVLFSEIGPAPEEGLVVEADTDEDGFFIATGLSAGDYTVEVFGYPSVTPNMISIGDGEILTDLELVIGYGGAVQGQVVDDENKEPMADVSITITSDAQGDSRVALTDAEGKYRFPSLESGLYRIRAEAQGYATRQYVGLQIWPGQVLRDVDFVLDTEQTLSGFVLDSETSVGIEGAAVAAQSEDGLQFATETAVDGSYTLENLSTGSYSVVSEAVGYQPSDEMSVELEGEGAVSIDFELESGATLPVRIVSAESITAISDAFVVCRNLQTGEVLTDYTASNGRISFSGVTAGVHYLYASAKDRAMVGKLVEVATGTMPVARLDLPLTRSLSGTCSDGQGGAPVEESFVVVENSGGSVLASGFTTQGDYQFDYLPQIPLVVTAYNPDLSYPVVNVSSEGTSGDLDPVSGGLTGTISSGEVSITSATVALYPTGDGAESRHPRFARSGADGGFQIDGVLPGEYLMTVIGDGYGRGRRTIDIGNQTINRVLGLPEEATASGRVLSALADEGQQPVKDAIVWFVLLSSPEEDPGVAAISDENGEFLVENLSSGNYIVRALAPGYVLQTTSPITLTAGEASPEIELYLTADGTILTGLVSDATETLPLVGAEVVFFYQGMEVSRSTVDSQGKYWSDPLAVGDYNVEVRFGTHLLRTSVTIAGGSANQTENFSVPLAPMTGIGVFDRLGSKPLLAASSKLHDLHGWFSSRDVPKDPREARLRSIDWDFYSDNGDCQPEAMGVRSELDSAMFAYWNAQDALENASWSAWRENAAVITQSFVVAGKIAEVVLSFKTAAVQALAALSDARETFQNVGTIVGDINHIYGTIQDVIAGVNAENNWDFIKSELKLLDKTVGKVLDKIQELKLYDKFGRLAAPIYKIKDIALELWNLYEEYNQAAETINATSDSYLQAQYQYHLRISRAWAEYMKFRDCQGGEDDPPFPAPDGNEVAGGTSRGVRSLDPNEKTGPGGFEAEIDPNEKITYTIFFENVPDASAAAQVVTVEDYLDEEKLNWDTFELLEVAFGDRNVAVPVGKRDYKSQVVLDEKYEVEIEAQFNRFSGKASWELTIIDPETGMLPLEGGVGFLPPNDDEGSGEGHVMFSISPVDGLEPGTEIRNEARIVFDANESIDTNETVHTIWSPGPDQPTNVSPAEGATTDLQPALVASAYSHPSGSTHSGSQFEVCDFELGGVVWDSTDSTSALAVTEIQVPTGVLESGSKYLWKVRYASEPVGSTEKWSQWSVPTWFETQREVDPSYPDFNGDEVIDCVDLMTILRNWHTSGQGDLDSSGRVDSMDLMDFGRHWQPQP